MAAKFCWFNKKRKQKVLSLFIMILSLFIVSCLFALFGLFNFYKKKPIIGWLFVLIGFFGLLLATIVFYLFPDKL